MSSRYLTKSRFKIGYECPSKLHYLDDSNYGSTNSDNTFLQALAEGGFQVGELAKIYHPGGVEITTIQKDEAAKETEKLLQQENAVIYEGAIKFENLFIKADLIVKRKNEVELIEVKAKSFDPSEEDPFYNKVNLKKGIKKISSQWQDYLVDIAFQNYVFKKAFPQFKIKSYLMLADKSATATVDGINQRFLLKKNQNGRVFVQVQEGTSSSNLGDKLLCKINVDQEIDLVSKMTFEGDRSFQEMVSFLSDLCINNKLAQPVVGSKCKTCEFRVDEKIKEKGLKSGFEKCWSVAESLNDKDFKNQFVFDIWNFRKSDKFINENKIFIKDLTEDDVSPNSSETEDGLSNSERQWIQIKKVIDNDKTPFFDKAGLLQEMKKWNYPLHFIDFETTMAAIPFNKGRRPYEQIAFQFSHHLVTKDLKIVHQTEYINATKGKFPNFDFVRKLKKALEEDKGTIFRYAAHENTVLCQIRSQLLDSKEKIDDRDELVKFIESITESTGDSSSKWCGDRSMVDMCELVKKFYYHPLTNGSNSIKKVLPAVLNESSYLKEKYQNPIYGSPEIVSKNFQNWSWIVKDLKGNIIDPYKLLPSIFEDADTDTLDSIIPSDTISDGGAAMTAYSRMQFSQMSEEETKRVTGGLLKYCELDTFAMVVIFEYWHHEIMKSSKSKKEAS